MCPKQEVTGHCEIIVLIYGQKKLFPKSFIAPLGIDGTRSRRLITTTTDVCGFSAAEELAVKTEYL